MQKYFVEFVGTYFLVLCIGMCIFSSLGNFAPMAIGLGLAAIIYAGWHISGAQYNPAVTIAVFLRGKCSFNQVPLYILSQLLGSILAGLTVMFLIPEKVDNFLLENPIEKLDVIKAFMAETIGTFFLVWVILNVATSKSHPKNQFYGLAIGWVVIAHAFMFGSISWAAFNPAVVLGFCYMKLVVWSDIWIYLCANILGAILATYFFKATSNNDFEN